MRRIPRDKKKKKEEGTWETRRNVPNSRNNFPYMRYFVRPAVLQRFMRAATPRYETTPITLSITSIDGRRHIDFTSNQRLHRVFLVDPRAVARARSISWCRVSDNSCFCQRMPKTPDIEPIGPVIPSISHSCSHGYQFCVSRLRFSIS